MSDTSPLVEALKALRKGDGLSLGSIAMLKNVDAIFGTDDYRAIRQAIVDAIRAEHDDKCVAALANALGVDTHARGNLTDRRERYIAEHKMSMRTLTNYEEFGAVVVAQLIKVPIAGNSAEVDRLLDIVDDLCRRARDHGGFEPDEQAFVWSTLRLLRQTPDEQIGAAQLIRLVDLIEAFRSHGQPAADAGADSLPGSHLEPDLALEMDDLNEELLRATGARGRAHGLPPARGSRGRRGTSALHPWRSTSG